MENSITATYLQLNNITPLCVKDSNRSIHNLCPNVHKEHKWAVQRKKRSINCIGLSCWVKWWMKINSGNRTTYFIAEWNNVLRKWLLSLCLPGVVVFHISHLPVALTRALMAAESCVKRRESVSSRLISISKQNPWSLQQPHIKSVCLCFSFVGNVK